MLESWRKQREVSIISNVPVAVAAYDWDMISRSCPLIWFELLVILGFIALGAKIGSIGIGYAGGAGVLLLTTMFGLKAGSLPTDVILIIMSVISLIAAMQTAGGMEYLVSIAERILRSNPQYVTFLAPCVTYTMT